MTEPLIREATAIRDASDDAGVAVAAGHLLARAAALRSEWSASVAYADTTIVAARRCSDALSLGIALVQRAEAATWGTLDVRRARADFREAIPLFERIKERLHLSRAVAGVGNLELKTGRFNESVVAFRRQIEICEEIGHRFGIAVAHVNLAYALYLAGDLDESAESARTALAMSATIDSLRMRVESRVNLALVERSRGRMAQAVELMEAAAEFARKRGIAVDLVDTLAQLSETYRLAGRHAEARRLAEEILPMIEGAEREMYHPQMVYWYVAKAFAIADPARSLALTHRANDIMRVRGAAIPDAESQANYYALPYNREIRERLGDRPDDRGTTRALRA